MAAPPRGALGDRRRVHDRERQPRARHAGRLLRPGGADGEGARRADGGRHLRRAAPLGARGGRAHHQAEPARARAPGRAQDRGARGRGGDGGRGGARRAGRDRRADAGRARAPWSPPATASSACEAPKVETKSAVGAGDAFSAGMVYGLVNGKPLDRARMLGIAAGAATAAAPGRASPRSPPSTPSSPRSRRRRRARPHSPGETDVPVLAMIRHGESDWNRENRFTGWVDVDLSARAASSRRAAAGELLQAEGLRLRPRLHLGPEARDPHALDRARRARPDVAAGGRRAGG